MMHRTNYLVQSLVLLLAVGVTATAVAEDDQATFTSPVVTIDTTSDPADGPALLPYPPIDSPLSAIPELEDVIAWDPTAITSSAERAEPVVVPEPSAFAMLAFLGCLLLAMTLLRWHFDRSTDQSAVSTTGA